MELVVVLMQIRLKSQGEFDLVSFVEQAPGYGFNEGQEVKRVLLKAREEGPTEEALQLFLLASRTTPHPVLGERFPVDVLMDRKIGNSTSASETKQKC